MTTKFGVVLMALGLGAGVCRSALVTVADGSGGGAYAPGERVLVSAADPAAGRVFSLWSGDTAALGLPDSPMTLLTVPAADVAIAAVYRDVGATSTTIDTAAHMSLVPGRWWVHAKVERKVSGDDHVTTNTTTCLGEQVFNGSPAAAVEELKDGQPFETAFYGLPGQSVVMEGTYDPDSGESMVWADGLEVLLATNVFVDGAALARNCALADDPGSLIPYTLRLMPNETITVPAGTFTCVRSQLWIPQFGWFNEVWAAPGVGKVKGHAVEVGNAEYMWELESASLGGAPVVLSVVDEGVAWYGEGDWFYQLESAENLAGDDWAPVDYEIVAGTNGPIERTAGAGVSNRFYRVQSSQNKLDFPPPTPTFPTFP